MRDGLKLTIIDPLTSLYNRRYVDHHLTKHFDVARESNAPLSLLIFDIDRFKNVNERFGNDFGHQALRIFAERLSNNIRGVDLIARVGREEFLVALPGINLSAGCAAAERVRKIAASPNPGAPRITVSAGVATLRSDDASPANLLKRADSRP